MKRLLAVPLLTTAALTAGCVTAREPEPASFASASLVAPDGAARGNARLVAIGDGLSLQVEVTGLSPGERGIHLHAAGLCTPPDFASAGGHLNPHARQHGTHNPQGSHLGDLPNIVIGADGRGSLSVTLPGTRAELEPILFDADGTAIVLHAGPDDMVSDPAGQSGPRVACGPFARTP